MADTSRARHASPASLPESAPSASRYAPTGRLKLHYLDYGTEGAKPLLFVHGGAAHGHWFDFVAGGFTADHHVRAVDLRGHGDSERADPPAYAYRDYADDIAAFAEALDLRDFTLVGHSMGGIVSLVYAANYSGRLGRLVVVDSRMHMSAENVARLRDFGTRPPSAYATQDDLVRRYRLEPPGTQIAPPEVIRYIAMHSGREQPDGTWTHKFDRSLYSIFERLDAMPCWDHVKVPALLVKGDKSDRIDDEALEEIRRRAPQVEVAVVADADHHVTLDNPRGFVEAVRRFLAR
ncbi:MAG TPA: alpha/beta hydrolase [Burkholderiales bacterium]|nr:alpha/beta hydrolase [Burkholderiales bacterium]